MHLRRWLKLVRTMRLAREVRTGPDRELGLAERWYAAQPMTRIAGVLIELDHACEAPRLEAALHVLRTRHDHALTSSLGGTARHPRWERLPSTTPLPIISIHDEDMWTMAEAHMLRAFMQPGPLWRVEVSRDRRVLMASFHHAIADGVSVGVFARELLQLLRGEALEPLAESQLPMDAHFDLRPPLGMLVRALRGQGRRYFAGSTQAHSELRTQLYPLRLSREFVEGLRQRARAHHATVHAALAVAAVAAALDANEGDSLPARLLSPVSLRATMRPPPRGMGLYLGALETDHTLVGQPFWTEASGYARKLERALPAAYQRIGLLRFAGDLTERAKQMTRDTPNGRTGTVEVSNLGRVHGFQGDARIWFVQGNHYHGPLFALSVLTNEGSGELTATLAVPAPVVTERDAKAFLARWEEMLKRAIDGNPRLHGNVA